MIEKFEQNTESLSAIDSIESNLEDKVSDFWDKLEQTEYDSTYDERLKQTPTDKNNERGSWTGERGESIFIPSDKNIQEILNKYDLDGINYKNAIPDFLGVSESTVKIDNMTENRAENFKQCDEICAKQWNREGFNEKTDWTPRDVADWRREKGFSWHECNDKKTCQLVPTSVNDYFGHLGGVAECKIAYSKEDIFDD